MFPPPPDAGVVAVIDAPLWETYRTAAFQVRLSLPIRKEI